MLKRKNSKRGFTFVELLIAMAVMSILLSIAVVAFTAVRKTGRDSLRKQTANQYKTAIEQYFVGNNFYPIGKQAINQVNPDAPYLPTDGLNALIPNYMSNSISDPDASLVNPPLTYIGNDLGSNYILYTNLEVGGFWVVCSALAGGGKIARIDAGDAPAGGWTDECPL